MRLLSRLSFKGIGVVTVLLVSLFWSGLMSPTSFAAPTTVAHIQLTPAAGPPTTQVQISGKGFGSQEPVVLAFDKKSLGVTAITSTNGTFSTKIHVPASATPGNHTVQATGQSSGLSAQAMFLVQTDWPMFGFDPQRTGYNPYENVLSPSTVSQLQLAWSSPYASLLPVQVNGTLYINTGTVYALDAQTGALKWSYSGPDINPFTSPAVLNGTLYVVGGNVSNSYVYALDAQSGILKWTFTVADGDEIKTNPAAVNGTVYFTLDEYLYALDAQSGTLKWNVFVGDILTAPAVANGLVYMAGRSGNVTALDASTGAQKWVAGFGDWLFSTPVVANGLVYVGLSGSTTYVATLDAQTGAIRWTHTIGGSFFDNQSAVVANGTVYIFSDNGKLHALDARNGAHKWMYNTQSSSFSEPAIANGVIYFSAGSSLYTLDAKTGALLWSHDVGGLHFSPIVTNGMVFAGPDAFHLPGM